MKILIGLAFPIGAALSLVKKGFLIVPIPFKPYSRIGFNTRRAYSFSIIFIDFFKIGVATWGGRLYKELRVLKDSITYFEDGFYRSNGHWKKCRVPDKVTYEHGAPYFINLEDSRLAKAIQSAEYFDLLTIKSMALHEFDAIRSGRGKYGSFNPGCAIVKAPEKIIALQDGLDNQIILSKNYESLYPVFKKNIDLCPISIIRGHPNNNSTSMVTGSFSYLKSYGLKNLVVYNSTSGLEAIINGIAVTYYGDSPVLRILNYDNVILPVTIIPTEEVVWKLTLAFYVIYPV
jgi:hypothetical protein